MQAKIISITAMLLFFNSTAYSQSTIITLTADQLAEKLINGNKPASVVQYWIPNCAAAESIVENFKHWEEQYNDQIDFYFVGITNRDSLILNLIQKGNYSYPLYVVDPIVDSNLNQRMQTFSVQLNKLLQRKPQSFITLYYNRKEKTIQFDKKAMVNEKKLLQLLKG